MADYEPDTELSLSLSSSSSRKAQRTAMPDDLTKKRSMADYDSDTELSLSLSCSRKARRTAMPDDLILEIVGRLPLEKTVQCWLLNKSLRHWISRPQFLLRHAATAVINCSAATPKLYTRFHTEFTSHAIVFETLERKTSILASCGGLLLLCLKPRDKNLHIFNPITGAIMPLRCPNYSQNRFGLAVDPDVAGSSFKVVEVDVARARLDQTLLGFTVSVPCQDGRSMCVESSTKVLVNRTITFADNHNMRPVYRAGTMYWLGNDGRIMVAYDIKNQRVSITHGPLSDGNQAGDKWFGSTSGSIWFVHAMQEEILIYGHDHRIGAWRVHHRLENIIDQDGDKYGQTCYFDGGRLFFLVRRLGADGAVHVYDVVRKDWEKRCVVCGWRDAGQDFFFFSPTTVKVSNIYLKELGDTEKMKMEMKRMNYFYWLKAKMNEDQGLLDTLLGLRRLLRSSSPN